MEQVEFFGSYAISSIAKIFDENSVRKIFLVTGARSYVTSGAQRAIKSCLDEIEVVRFSDFSVNPKFDEVMQGVDRFKKSSPDMVVAIGGGSVIDMAKSINIIASNQSNNLLSNIDGRINKGRPLVAIPTTAGTGSEATHFAVIYVNGKKKSLSHQFLLPDYVIVDPRLSYNMPSVVAASSGLDALAQSVESYWSINSTAESKKISENAIRIILPNIVNAVTKKNKKSMDALSYGANLSGKAINISKTTAAHAMSYSIGELLNIPHGYAVSLTLGCFFAVNNPKKESDIADCRGGEYLRSTMNDLYELFGVNSGEECYEYWRKLINQLGLESDMKILGFDALKINKVISSVNVERLYNNPIRLDENGLRDILIKL